MVACIWSKRKLTIHETYESKIYAVPVILWAELGVFALCSEETYVSSVLFCWYPVIHWETSDSRPSFQRGGERNQAVLTLKNLKSIIYSVSQAIFVDPYMYFMNHLLAFLYCESQTSGEQQDSSVLQQCFFFKEKNLKFI